MRMLLLLTIGALCFVSCCIVAEKERAGLLQEIEGLKTVVATLRENGLRVREEKAVLEHRLQHVQGQCQEKIKVCNLCLFCHLEVHHFCFTGITGEV